MEDVVGGARAVGLQVVVVEVIVVDEGAIEHHAAVRRERVGQQIGGIGGAAAIAGGAGWPSESAFTVNPAKSGICVDLV
jgi:hypothetical protein